MNKVVVYIDGFNLYFGIKALKKKNLYWLDLKKLSLNLLQPTQTLVLVKYFTSRISSPTDKAQRQKSFLEATETLSDVKIYYGQYISTIKTCRYCGNSYHHYSEKKTDVNLAVEMLIDAFNDEYDTAIVISADSDLSGSISSVLKRFPTKRIITAFPPKRSSVELKSISSATINIYPSTLRRSLLPPAVTKPDGFVITCPIEWVYNN